MRHAGLRLSCSLLILCGAMRAAQARPMTLMESRPAAHAVMSGAVTQFFVRFDGPVDHAASVLTVLGNGRVVQSLHARLNSQPDTLYASGGKLPPGDYVLQWQTRSMADHDVSSGSIPFSVARHAP